MDNDKIIDAFLTIHEFMQKQCNKYNGTCLECQFLEPVYKRCLMAVIFHEPNSMSHEELENTINENIKRIQKTLFK